MEGGSSPPLFRLPAESDFRGPISLHEEDLDHPDPERVPRHLAAMERNLRTLRDWMRDVEAAR